MSETPRLSPVASPTGPVAQAPRTNTALELASSLSELNGNLRQFSGAFAAQLKEAGEVKGKAAAQSAQGKAFADAVRDGRLRSTQNPFFIRAYEREAASIRGREALNELRVSAASWEERSDPTKFQQRWNEEVGNISGSFTDFDQQEGFQPVNAEITNQVLNANIAEAAARINKSRVDNMGALIAERVGAINAANGGNASPQSVIEGTAELRADWISTGGSIEEFDELYKQAVTTTAYASSDPDLLDLLRTPLEEGATPIYNRPGVANQVENDRYYIGNARRRALTQGEEDDYAVLQMRAREAKDYITTNYGRRFILGNVGVEQVYSDLEKQGFTPPEIAQALGGLQDIIATSNSWTRAVGGAGSKGDVSNFDLFLEASQGGSSEDLIEQTRQGVANGTISDSEARTIINEAQAADRRLGKQNAPNGAAVIDSQSDLNARVTDLNVVVGQQSEQVLKSVSARAAQMGVKVPYMDSFLVKERIQAAASRVMVSDNASFAGAYQAARDEAAAAIQEYISELQALGVIEAAPQKKQ